jgi:hypothetical protein
MAPFPNTSAPVARLGLVAKAAANRVFSDPESTDGSDIGERLQSVQIAQNKKHLLEDSGVSLRTVCVKECQRRVTPDSLLLMR